jgi:multiple sugar transport system substrate-binding protein
VKEVGRVGRLAAVVCLAAVAALATFAGIASGAASHAGQKNDSNTITFLVPEYSTKTVPYWNDTVAAFEKANPGLHVNLQSMGWQQAHDTTAQMIAANQLPDLVNTATIWLPEWVQANAILPITSDIVSPDVEQRFVPALFQDSAFYKGKSYGLPIAAAARGMFYNKDLFKKAGISKPPTTWAEMLADAVKIKKKTGAFGYAFDGKGVQAFRYFGFFLWNNKGTFFTKTGKAAFNRPQGVQALSFLVKLVKTGAVPDPSGLTAEDIEALFLAGRVGMWVDGNYFTTQLASKAPGLHYGVAPVPVSRPGVPPVTWGVTDTLVVGKNANIPVVKKFISFIYQASYRTTFDTNEGFLPLLTSQQSLPQFSDPVTTSFVKQLARSRFDPLNPYYSQMQELVMTAMQQAIAGSATPKAALDRAAAKFNKLAGK